MYWEILQEIKAALEGLPGVKTLGIGLEKGIGAKDCPFVRIVAVSNENEGFGQESFDFSVFFGFDVKNADLETLYEKLYELEDEIKTRLVYKIGLDRCGVCKFVRTDTDADALANLKAAVSHFRVEGLKR